MEVAMMQPGPWTNAGAPPLPLTGPTDPRLDRRSRSMENGSSYALVNVQQAGYGDLDMEASKGTLGMAMQQHEQGAGSLSCMQPLPPSADWSKLQQRVSELRVAVAHWDTICMDLKQQVVGLTASLQEKHAENSYLQVQCAQVTQDLQLLLSATQQQEEDVQGQLLAGLRADLEDANQRCLGLEAELQALQFQLAETDAHAAAAVASEREERQRLASELGGLRLLLAARQRHLDTLQEHAAQQQAAHMQELEERAQQADEADRQLAEVRQQLANEHAHVMQAEAAAEQLGQQLHDLQAVCGQQEQQLQAYSAQVAELQIAREWLEAAVADFQSGHAGGADNLLQLHQALKDSHMAQAALCARAEQAEALVQQLQQEQQRQLAAVASVAELEQQVGELQGQGAAVVGNTSQAAATGSDRQVAGAPVVLQQVADLEGQLLQWQERAVHAEALLQQQQEHQALPQQQHQQLQYLQPQQQEQQQQALQWNQGSNTEQALQQQSVRQGSTGGNSSSGGWAAALISCSDDDEEIPQGPQHSDAMTTGAGNLGVGTGDMGAGPIDALTVTLKLEAVQPDMQHGEKQQGAEQGLRLSPPGSTASDELSAASTHSYSGSAAVCCISLVEAACQTEDGEPDKGTLSIYASSQEMAAERKLLLAQDELASLRAAHQHLQDQLAAKSGMVPMEAVTKTLEEVKRLSKSKLEQGLAVLRTQYAGQLKDAADAVTAAEARAAAAAEELGDLQATRQALLGQLQAAREEAEQLRQQLQEQEQQLNQVRLECESDTAAVLLDATSSSHAQLAAAAQQVIVLEQQLQTAHVRIEELQQQVVHLQHTADTQVQALQQQVSELQQLSEQDTEQSAAELQAARTQALELQDKVAELQAARQQVTELQEQVSELQAASMQVTELQGKVVELQQVEGLNEELRQQLMQAQLQLQEAPVPEELQARENEIVQQQRTIEDLRQRVAELEQAQSTLLQQIDELELISVQVSELQLQLQGDQQARADIHGLQHQLEELQTQKAQAEDLNSQLGQQLLELQVELKQLHNQGQVHGTHSRTGCVMCDASTQAGIGQAAPVAHVACQAALPAAGAGTQAMLHSKPSIALHSGPNSTVDAGPVITALGVTKQGGGRAGLLLQPEQQQQQQGSCPTAAARLQLHQLRASLCATMQRASLQLLPETASQQQQQHVSSRGSAPHYINGAGHSTGAVTTSSGSRSSDKCEQGVMWSHNGHSTPRDPLLLEPPPPEASDSPNVTQGPAPDGDVPQSCDSPSEHQHHRSGYMQQQQQSSNSPSQCDSQACNDSSMQHLQQQQQQPRAAVRQIASSLQEVDGDVNGNRRPTQDEIAADGCVQQQQHQAQQHAQLQAPSQRHGELHTQQEAVSPRLACSLGAIDFYLGSADRSRPQRMTQSDEYQPSAFTQQDAARTSNNSIMPGQSMADGAVRATQHAQHRLGELWPRQDPSHTQESWSSGDHAHTEQPHLAHQQLQHVQYNQAAGPWPPRQYNPHQELYVTQQQHRQAAALHTQQQQEQQFNAQLRLPEQGNILHNAPRSSQEGLSPCFGHAQSEFRQADESYDSTGLQGSTPAPDVMVPAARISQTGSSSGSTWPALSGVQSASQPQSITALADDISHALRQSRKHLKLSEAQEVAARKLVAGQGMEAGRGWQGTGRQAGQGQGAGCRSLRDSMEGASLASEQFAGRHLHQQQRQVHQQRPPLVPLENQHRTQVPLLPQHRHVGLHQHARDAVKPRQPSHYNGHLMEGLEGVEQNLQAAAAPRTQHIHKPQVLSPAVPLTSRQAVDPRGAHGGVTLWNLPPPSDGFDDHTHTTTHPSLPRAQAAKVCAAVRGTASSAAVTVSLSSLRMSTDSAQQHVVVTKPQVVANRRYHKDA